MQLIRQLSKLPNYFTKSVVSIGNFDGVHKGHQDIIKKLCEKKVTHNAPAVVVTFEPLAREYFQDTAPLRLTTIEHRAKLLGQLGVDIVLCLAFDENLVHQSAQDFVEKVLYQALGVCHLYVGDDFAFGHNRDGDYSFLQKMAKRYGFFVQSHKTVIFDKERVSSARVRESVLRNQFDIAHQLLGRAFSIEGVVTKGEQRGRLMQFPTANILLHSGFLALKGVYAVSCVISQKYYQGVANIGTRPTVSGKENRLEAHFFHFNDDIYGQTIEVKIHFKIREEKKFASLIELTEQIHKDSQFAQQFFAKKNTANFL